MRKSSFVLFAVLFLLALAACGDSGGVNSSQHSLFTDGITSNWGEFTEETYSGTVTELFKEGGTDVLAVTLDNGEELYFSFLEVTEVSGTEDIVESDYVEIESGYYEGSSGFHPIFSIKVK